MISTKTAIDQILTHIRTYQFYNLLIKRNDPGTIPPANFTRKQIDKLIRSKGLDSFTTLKALHEAGKITVKSITENGYQLLEIATTEPGPVDISIIKPKGKPLNELTKKMLSFLPLISFPPEIDVPDYFRAFLEFKNKHPRFFFLVDTYSGRVHTPVTNLHRHLRPFIELAGEQTISFDVKTMQPLILGKLLKSTIGNNDFSNWIDSGLDVYEMIMEKTGIQNRDKAKPRFYKITYGYPSNELAEMFGGANWIDWINQFKKIKLPGNPRTKDTKANRPHTNLAWTLQASEVKIMSDVWGSLISKDIPFISVHDEIIVPKSHRDQSRDIFNSVLGVHFTYYRLNESSPSSVV